jgi:hypothetical protein
VPYALGAVHNITGTGEVAVASPVGLKITVTRRPSWVGGRGGNPPEFFPLGRLVLGNADGWLAPLEVLHDRDLRYPIADGMTRLGHTLGPDVDLVVQELAAAAPAAPSESPWMRSPSTVRGQYVTSVAANTAQQQVYTYTVPAGRKLQLAHCRVSVKGWFAGSANGYAQAWVYLNGGVLVLAVTNDPAVTTYVWDQLGSPIYLNAGATLTMNIINAFTSGVVYVTMVLAGTEFNA